MPILFFPVKKIRKILCIIYFTSEDIAYAQQTQTEQAERIDSIHSKVTETQDKRYSSLYWKVSLKRGGGLNVNLTCVLMFFRHGIVGVFFY